MQAQDPSQTSLLRPGSGGARGVFNLWSLGAILIALLVLAPIATVIWLAFNPVENIWPHLTRTTLPRYLSNTLILMLGVGAVTAAVGATTAWLVCMYRFPGARVLEYALLLPLAVPAYVGAYALVDLLEYSGPVQVALREAFGWASARDYWFPRIRSRGFAILVLSAALYPYVYLLARAAFREQSGASYEVARALGSGGLRLFFRVGLPLARPAIAVGVALAMMETVNDYGVVSYFAVQTLTTGIFTVWLSAGNPGGAAQLATVILGLILLLVALERLSRRRQRYFQSARHSRPIEKRRLSGVAGLGAMFACAVPVALGFVVPLGVILWHALQRPDLWLAPGLLRALRHTLVAGGAAAFLAVLAALFLVYGVRLTGRSLPRLLLPFTTIGYAAPGAVLAVGLLIPLAAMDHRLADGIAALTGNDPGLILTGTAFAVVLAYVIRFFAIAQGAVDAAFGRVSPSLPMAAHSLGRGRTGVLTAVYLPLMRGTVGTALLLVFVDCVKELPATLLLRPFNYNTLATLVHEKASTEALTEAAPAAVLIVLVASAAVALLARANR
ncbi:ABC transporter permease [Halodurantibacterium flavum]|uniref:ABC transporter permease n=1 Tax=Halodurantibacterium flavum TaxID=1382802 RepID=A0ABW4S7J9_9RHOB